MELTELTIHLKYKIVLIHLKIRFKLIYQLDILSNM